MFVASVLVGTYAVGDSHMKVPPFRNGDSGLRHDSTVNGTTPPSIYVVYRDNQAYPKYLLELYAD
jgi:poly [ADP-ribose] polymerase 10/14/15